MATPKTAVHEHQLTITLTDEQYELLEAFAAEKGIDDLARALPDVLFVQSTAPLDEMAR
jgi:hypothetical protein